MDKDIEHSLKRLENDAEQDDTYYNAVNVLAMSNLPNGFFLQQFNSAPVKMTLWEGYAKVLTKRGVSNVEDVKQEMMIWLQDPCWPGFNAIVQFIVENKACFKTELLRAIFQAFEQNEPEWLEYIYLTYEKCYGVTPEQKETVYDIKEAVENKIDNGVRETFAIKLAEAFPFV